jgi:poly(3-hydroxybutyrate) depolymerase
MKTRPTSFDARVGFCSGRHAYRFFGAALALAAGACSSDGEAPSAPGPSMSPPATVPSAGDEVMGSGAPDEATAPAMQNGTPAPSASEGTGVTPLSPPEPQVGSGESSPSLPNPEMAGDEPEPGAAEPTGSAGPAVPSAGCGQTRTIADGTQTIASGGMNRTYLLETPDDYDNTYPYRVIFMFHWNYGSINAIVNPPDADRNTDRPFYGLDDLTDGKTIFVVPQGLVNAGGGAGWANPNNRDVNFTDDMLAAISSDLCIDTSRVFTTGFSYGAGMSIALACVRPDKFRAALVYEPGFISGVQPAQCTTPIPFFQSHGVDDPILDYQTGLNVLDVFSSLNGCTATTPANPPADGHTCVSLEGCSVPTRFCNFGAGEGNPFNTSLRGHYPVPKDPGQSTSWVPSEAWSFITQF